MKERLTSRIVINQMARTSEDDPFLLVLSTPATTENTE